jgi:hypothetical protein
MNPDSKPDTYKKGSDGVSEEYLCDIEKELYNIAVNYMPHLKNFSMQDQLDKIQSKK